eukprot:403350225
MEERSKNFKNKKQDQQNQNPKNQVQENNHIIDVCLSCGLKFDSGLKQKMIVPCGDIACLQCLDQKISPQDNSFYCLICDEHIQIPRKFQQSLQNLIQEQRKLRLNCRLHNNKKAHYYCSQCKAYACSQCNLKNHVNHQEQIQIQSSEQIQNQLKTQVSKLIEQIEQSTKILAELQIFDVDTANPQDMVFGVDCVKFNQYIEFAQQILTGQKVDMPMGEQQQFDKLKYQGGFFDKLQSIDCNELQEVGQLNKQQEHQKVEDKSDKFNKIIAHQLDNKINESDYYDKKENIQNVNESDQEDEEVQFQFINRVISKPMVNLKDLIDIPQQQVAKSKNKKKQKKIVVNPKLVSNGQEKDKDKFKIFEEEKKENHNSGIKNSLILQKPNKITDKKFKPIIDENMLKDSQIQNTNNKYFGFDKFTYQAFSLSRKKCNFISENFGSTTFKSLYIGSYNNFSSLIFHNFCDNKGKLMILIKTQYQRVFAIFVSNLDLNQSDGKNQYKDEQAMLLQITHMTVHKQKESANKSLFVNRDTFIRFNLGKDEVLINDNCSEDGTNICRLSPDMFKYPEEFIINQEESKLYMGGAEYFKIEEIECLRVL